MKTSHFNPNDYIGTTRSGARLYRAKNPKHAAKDLVDVDYSHHKLWGAPIVTRSALRRIVAGLLFVSCIPGFLILIDILFKHL